MYRKSHTQNKNMKMSLSFFYSKAIVVASWALFLKDSCYFGAQTSIRKYVLFQTTYASLLPCKKVDPSTFFYRPWKSQTVIWLNVMLDASGCFWSKIENSLINNRSKKFKKVKSKKLVLKPFCLMRSAGRCKK